MTDDLIQRAAAMSSDQLAAWLSERCSIEIAWFRGMRPTVGWRAKVLVETERVDVEGETLLGCLAAAVVEVDRIEREAHN